MKKQISVLISLILALGTLVSCKTPSEQSGTNSDVNSGNVSDVQSETSTLSYTAKVPDVNYEGLEFKILTRVRADAKYSEFGFGEETEAGAIDTAVEERNAKVEEKLGIDILEAGVVDFGADTVSSVLRKAASSESDIYYIVSPQLYDAAILATEGLFYDLYSLENLNGLTEAWWDKYFLEETTLDSKAFFVTGDIGFSAKDSLTVCFFNKNMIQDFGLADPYQLVREHKWTIDTVLEYSKKVKNDENNDGEITYKDSFGVGGQYDLMWAMFYGSGQRLAEKDGDGMPVLSAYNDQSVAVMDKILKLMNDKNYFVCANDYFNDPGYKVSPTEYITSAFMSGRALFFFEALSVAEDLRATEANIEFGILPVPLYDEEQSNYQHMINPWGGNAFAIPKYIGDEKAKIASIVMDTLGAESKNLVTPAYYDIALKQQKTRDTDSQEMLDLIFSTLSIDVGHVYNWGQMGFTLLHGMIGQDIGAFNTKWDAMKDSVQLEVDATIEKFKSIQ